MIRDRILKLQSNISLICQRLGRDPKEITLVGVTKYATFSMIEEAVSYGLTHIAENKVQEALKKFSQLKFPGRKITRHMIGHLQTNKARDALTIFDMIQSVDSVKLASAIDKQALRLKRRADVLIQVNTSGEAQRFGIAPKETLPLMKETIKLSNLRILGLMTMAPLTDDKEAIRRSFRKLKELQGEAVQEFGVYENFEMKYLSMGMSGDYEIALEEGSNMIRIGRAIFG